MSIFNFSVAQCGKLRILLFLEFSVKSKAVLVLQVERPAVLVLQIENSEIFSKIFGGKSSDF